MTALLKYDAARQALAECKTFDEVRDWEDKAAAVREYSRRVRDRGMELDAIEIRELARLRRGEMLLQLEETGELEPGRKKKVTGQVPNPITLESLGVSKNESSRDQKIAALGEAEFNRRLAMWREKAEKNQSLHAFSVVDDPGPIAGSRSIMSSRQEPDDSLDFFPTPPWSTRALMECVLPRLQPNKEFLRESMLEPACGDGHIAEVLREYSPLVAASDIHPYGYGLSSYDFLKFTGPSVDWIITNPPFHDKTEGFVLKALEWANVGVAMFVRLQWLESGGRYETIFQPHPPTLIAFFAERVPLCKGEWKPTGSTATAYIWLVWLKDQKPRAPFWIPPGQRERLTYPDDAVRFTAKPVIRKEDYNPNESRTTQEQPNGTDAAISSTSAPEPASAQVLSPQPTVDAGSPSFPEIILPGMAPTFKTIAAFVDLTSAQSANGS